MIDRLFSNYVDEINEISNGGNILSKITWFIFYFFWNNTFNYNKAMLIKFDSTILNFREFINRRIIEVTKRRPKRLKEKLTQDKLIWKIIQLAMEIWKAWESSSEKRKKNLHFIKKNKREENDHGYRVK